MQASPYTLSEYVGKGANASVYKAFKPPNMKDPFAVKVMDRARIEDPRRKQTLLREISCMRKLDHPKVLKLYEVLDFPDTIQLVLEFIEGGDLLKRVMAVGRFPEDQVKIFMKGLLEVLTYLHSVGIVHRDLKLENILLTSRTSLTDFKIADFGLAIDHNADTMISRCGSPGYIAPEILRKEQYGRKVDVFSAGVICYIL
jgi:serine/threonine protein kinase